MNRLADLTTLRLGGPAHQVVDCPDQDSLVAAVRQRDEDCQPLIVMGGGSNIVAADEGFAGTVILVRTAGIERSEVGDRVILTVQAGESWDRLVDRCVDEGLAGIECLAGIPGSAGATPIQNVGAYGQEVAQSIVEVVAYDRESGEVRHLSPEECGFSYRSSAFKRHKGRWVVLEVSFALRESDTSDPIRYAELARCLGVEVGETAPLSEVRNAILGLRRSKGMVLDAADPDTVSAGSFFLNPVLEQADLGTLRRQVRARYGPNVEPPSFAAEDGKVKTSAAWLIEQAGFHRGYGSPDGIAISGKHTLALTNRGHGTTSELVTLARQIAGKVRLEFGIELKPEPVFVGHEWSAE